MRRMLRGNPCGHEFICRGLTFYGLLPNYLKLIDFFSSWGWEEEAVKFLRTTTKGSME